MFKRLRHILRNNEKWHHKTHLQNMELEWAHVFRDSIRGKPWLETLPLNIGRWAGGYAFFYVLCRILNDNRPQSIVEFGLGESTKVINQFLAHQLNDSQHLVIEESPEWRDAFTDRFTLGERSEIKICPPVTKTLQLPQGEPVVYNGYEKIETAATRKYDLYVVDGPRGSEQYSRYDIVTLTENLTADDQFMILIDDYERGGEQQTANALIEQLAARGVKTHTGVYAGNAATIVVATDKYRFTTTL